MYGTIIYFNLLLNTGLLLCITEVVFVVELDFMYATQSDLYDGN